MGIRVTEVLLDIFCCCCESWRRKLKQSESTTAIVSSPSETHDLNHKAHEHNGKKNSVAFWVTKSPSTTTEIRKVQPSNDPYYSDDSSSSKEELSHSAEDLRPRSNSGLMVERELRPRSNSARHLSRSRSPSRTPEKNKKTGSSSKDTSPVRSPPQGSPQHHAKLVPKRSGEGGPFKSELGQIQPELYVTEAVQTKYITQTSSSRSPNKKDELLEECFGTMTFSVKYDQSRLIVHLKEITDLPIKGGQTAQSEMTYDSVVEACLLPDEKPILRSKVIKETLNPIFDETLVIPIDRSKNLEHVALRMTVFCSENCLKHETIGHVVVPLSDCGAIGTEKDMMMRIHKKSQVCGEVGNLLVSLAYLPSLERLSAVIIRAKDIKGEKGTTTEALETYVKVTLMCQGDKVKTRRTTAVKGTPNPVFTESLSYVVPMSLIDSTCLIIQVAQKTHFKRDPILGQLILGPFMYTTGNSLSHWGKMLNSREASKSWHLLYM